jgi:hypothetical protein
MRVQPRDRAIDGLAFARALELGKRSRRTRRELLFDQQAVAIGDGLPADRGRHADIRMDPHVTRDSD